MTESETWTIGKLLDWTKDYLAQQGAESPRLDAEVLLAHAKGCKRIELYTAFDEVASDALRASFRSLIKRRADGMPVAYLVEEREFYSLTFRVSPDVLIPRPETEFLVIRLLDLIKERDNKEPVRILDVGTGSGILAICAAVYLPDSKVVAVDISLAAIEVARENAKTHNVSDQIEFVHSNLLESISSEQKFDFIVSNPPYVSDSEYEELDTQVKDFEPKTALVAGKDGMDVIRALVPAAASQLQPGGWLLMEISPMIDAAVRAELESNDDFRQVGVTKDLAKLPRIVEAQRG